MDVTIIHPEKGNDEQNDLVRFDITTSAIEEMQRNYMALKINDINDKNGYKVVFNARQIVKNKRILVKKTADELETPYKDKINAIRAEEKRILNLLEPIEQYLQSEEDTYLKLIEDQKAQAARKEQQRIQERIDKLSQLGYRIDYSEIKSMTDIAFNDVLKQAEIKHNEEIQAKAEQERLKKEQEEKFRQQAEEYSQLKRTIEAEKQALKNQKVEAREQLLSFAGMTKYKTQWYNDKGGAIQFRDVENLSDLEFSERLLEIQDKIESGKIKEAEQKCLAEEEEKKRVEQLKPDTQKIREFAESLNNIQYPDVNDEAALIAIHVAKNKIFDIQVDLLKRVDQFNILIASHDTETNSVIVENGNHAE